MDVIIIVWCDWMCEGTNIIDRYMHIMYVINIPHVYEQYTIYIVRIKINSCNV